MRADFTGAVDALDVERRVRATPSTAMVRGLFFNLIEADLERRGLVGLPVWANQFHKIRKSYELYPATDLIRASTMAGTLVDDDPSLGMRMVHASTATYFASTWYGRAFRRFLHPDPADALSWIERSRHHIANYGRWRYEHRGPGRGILHMFDEYCCIETIQRGGCEGLLTACGVQGEVDVELDAPFQGRLLVRWDVPN